MKVLSPRRSGFTLRELLLLLLVVGMLAALSFPVFFRARDNERTRTCQSRLKQICLGFLQYAQDYNDHLPRVSFQYPRFDRGSFAAYGWAGTLYPYLRSVQLFQCPSEPTAASPHEDPSRRDFTDYYMNRNLSGVRLDKIEEPALVILSGDGNDGTDNTDARYALRAIPSQWRLNEKSPAYRHGSTGNYLFADGHVFSHRPQIISTSRTPSSKGVMFAPQITR
jgi:prepilin-type processing-associated H-X9-DG protein